MAEEKKGAKSYLVHADILPEAIYKTALAKELLAKGQAKSINEAVKKVGLSRSVFYKYRAGIFPIFRDDEVKTITVLLILAHEEGVLSSALNTISTAGGNILMLNQGLPLEGVAHVSISIDRENMKMETEELFQSLSDVPGVLKVELIGQNNW